MIDKKIIKNNFSKYARYYDRYATIQNICAKALIGKIGKNNLKNILDIGCGTGNYTKLLREKFPNATIKAVDISSEMVEVAKNKLKNKDIEFVIEDAETIDVNEKFDLISSNAAFQWFEDLKTALINYKQGLKRNGIISFSIFGPLTFYELDRSLKQLNETYESTSSGYFLDKNEIRDVLNNVFNQPKIEQNIYKQKYHSLQELLKNIKYTGTRGNGIGAKNFWTKKALDNLEKIYRKKFTDIVATYQVFFCKGVN